MFSTTLFIIVAAIFATFTSAASGAPFEITGTNVQKVLGANVTVSFTIHDPDPLTNATNSCTASWVTGSKGYPTGPYKPCGNSSFAWRMESWNSVESFVLGVEHDFQDPSIGDPPYDYITNFGKATVNTTSILCSTKGGKKNCAQKLNTVIKAPIYASSA